METKKTPFFFIRMKNLGLGVDGSFRELGDVNVSLQIRATQLYK